MISRWAVVVALGVACGVLTGCLSPAELRARDEAQCEGYGFKEGTDGFASCLQTEAQGRAMRHQTAVDAASSPTIPAPQPWHGPDLAPGLIYQSSLRGPP
jgi:hypothetical protein